jgi:hypothetical protein
VFIRVSFTPNAHLVATISRTVSDFCRVAVRDTEIAVRFQIAAHELAENIVKYSTGPEVTVDIELLEKDGMQSLKLRTRNRTSPQRLVEVEKRVSALMSAPDPAAFYDRLIEESIAHKGVSGLGLARIRAESGFDVGYSVEGDELTLVVSGAVPKPQQLASSA